MFVFCPGICNDTLANFHWESGVDKDIKVCGFFRLNERLPSMTHALPFMRQSRLSSKKIIIVFYTPFCVY